MDALADSAPDYTPFLFPEVPRQAEMTLVDGTVVQGNAPHWEYPPKTIFL